MQKYIEDAIPAKALKMHRKRLSRSWVGDVAFVLILGLMGVIMVLPLIYAVVNAFKPLEEFYVFPPRFFVINPTFGNFLDLMELAANMWVPLSRYVFNSLFVTTTTVVLYVVICASCAYPLAKHDFLGKSALNGVVVTSMMFTSVVMSVPQYIMMAKTGMVDTYLAIIVPALGSSLGVFLMRQFMEDFPMSIIESARVEGAGEFFILWRIVMPGQKPAWITVMIFTFQSVWGATAGNMIFTENIKTLPHMLSQIASSGVARAGVSAASTLLILLPNLLFFIFCQSNVMETMSNSGIKE